MKKIDKDAKHSQRLEVIEKIKAYEKLGGDKFFADIETDPPSRELLPHEVDYLKTRLSSKIKTLLANIIVGFLRKKYTKKLQIEVVGKENLLGIAGGAIITSNHFSIYDSLPVANAVNSHKKRRLHIVVKEGNYFVPGFNGFILKNANTLPLSGNLGTMRSFNKALSALLERGQYVLIYPEQAMWWNYRKPRPHKPGAVHYAIKNNVPIIPCFVTMSDLTSLDEHGFPHQKYTIHIMKPIYPDKNKSKNENQEQMMAQNMDCCKQKYEQAYGIKLQYS